MRFRKIGLLILSLLIVGWGFPMAVRADVQQSTYTVELTPPKSSTSGTLESGNDGDLVNEGSNSGTTIPTNVSNSGSGATVSQSADKGTPATSQGLTGRLPQTSEERAGLGAMAGIILMLFVWIGILIGRRKDKDNQVEGDKYHD
ncbi:LPXTG cell wall anchor domain-containing protein [Levilactobacillus fujinensis]|uniref:LPXTG cell wall anchor domain-containing protein n=1 Tax=Levilactobacillus fujinensis TaxID=2486024 RepID=A0ABW1TIX5_9LACO|nr:LPXTG cell wall anchor domain-containing protein [Levilactobacillus fujinensis]